MEKFCFYKDVTHIHFELHKQRNPNEKLVYAIALLTAACYYSPFHLHLRNGEEVIAALKDRPFTSIYTTVFTLDNQYTNEQERIRGIKCNIRILIKFFKKYYHLV